MDTASLSALKSGRLLSFLILSVLPWCVSGQTAFEQLQVISPNPTPNHINNLKHVNGKFVATTENAGVIISSDDGITWSSHITGHSGSTYGIAYGNGIYMISSYANGPAYYSSDLESWTEISSNNLPSNTGNVYFHDGLFYFMGAQHSDNPGFVTTADGVTFNEVATPGESGITDLVFANNQFVSVGNDLEIMTSPDGVTWTVRPTGASIEGLGQGLLSVRYINSLYVVGGKANTILTSPDGITWTHRTFSEDSSWFFDSWHDGSTYYFPGRSRKLWTTTDFSSWTSIQMPDGPNDTIHSIVNAEGISVVIGRQGMIYTSTDQTTWTSRKTGYSSSISDVAYGAGLFVACFYDTVINSVDGTNWSTSSPPGLNYNWRHILYEDGKFVVMTDSGEWSLSADGKIWSVVSEELDPYPGIEEFRYLNGKWFVTGRDGFLRSSDSLVKLEDWDVHDIFDGEHIFDVTYGNGIYVAVGRPGAIYTSEDGVNWVSRESGTTNDLHSIAYGNGKFVIIGGVGTALTSTDGVTWTPDGQQGNPNSSGGLVFRDGQFITFSTLGRVYISSDGVVWDQVRAPTGALMLESAQSDEDLVVIGQNGLIMQADLPPKKNLTINIEGQGEVVASPSESPYPHLAKVTLTATADEDFAFSQWSGDIVSGDNPLVVEMDADKTITANFVLSVTGYRLWVYQYFNETERDDDEISGEGADPDEDGLTNEREYELGTNPKEVNGPHTLVVNIVGEGSVELSPPGGGPYTYGTEVTVTPTGTPEFAFTSWSGTDGSGSDNPLVVVMDKDKTINANFSLDLDGFLLFRYTSFTAEERVDDEIAGPQADFDLDGLSNLEEYLLGTDPKVPDFGKGVQVGTVKIGNQTYFTLTYQRSKDINGISQSVEVGSDLSSWDDNPANSEVYGIVDNGDGTESVTLRLLDPIGSLPTWFARIIFEES